MPQSVKRTTEALIILAMTGASSLAIFPFAVTRLMQGDLLLAGFDFALVAGLAAVGAYVHKTHRTELGANIVSILGVGAIVGTVYIKGVEQVFWMYPTILVVFYLLTPIRAVFASVIATTLLMPVLLTANDTMFLMTTITTIGLTAAFAFAFSSQTLRQREQLIHLATKDPLTGAGNRRALGTKLREIIAQHQREPVTASLLLLDLDHFKRVNDQYGHAAGDLVLVGLVQVIEQRIRETDSVYRIGGEEFLIVAERMDDAAAQLLAEDLRVLVAAARLAETHPVTVSVGVAQLGPGENADDWLRRGDNALYEAKDRGRDCVVSQQTRALTELEIARMERDATRLPAG
ncbi:MAG: GGDEF domain-containing protein [Pseudomonadota bacterium]